MKELQAARYNIYWFLSFLVPAVILFVATYWHRRRVLVLGVFLSLSVAVPLRIAAVFVRWDKQIKVTNSLEEIHAVWARDPPVLMEVAFIAPLQALLSVGFWSPYWWGVWPWVRRHGRGPPPVDKTYGETLKEIAVGCAKVCVKAAPGILIALIWLTYASCVAWQYRNYATDDPMSDTGSALFLGFVMRTGFVLTTVATTIIACIWLTYYLWQMTTGHRSAPTTRDKRDKRDKGSVNGQ